MDLSTRTTWVESLGETVWRRYLGGRSLIAHYLLTQVPTGADPLGADNVLVFAAGVLTGTPFPGAGRHSVGAKSPLTGLFGESESGGFWGAELRHAGWDAIVVHGRASSPVYLWIKNEAVEIRDASNLWGLETDAVEDALRAEHSERLLRVAQTGIAGEHLVRFALVVNDLNEVAGRTGMGAVMGSKNLKAIAVRGTQKVPVADPKPLQATARWVIDTMEDVHYNFHHFGTGAGIIGKHLEGHMIVRNFQDGQWDPEQIQAIDARTIAETTLERMDGCYACSVRCKKRVKDEALHVLPKFGGPEYETIGSIGTNLTIGNLPMLMLVNQRLNQVGIDSVSFGSTVAWAMECFERGLLRLEDTGGIALRWGDADTVLQIVDLVARREGALGQLLADGALAAA
ncbi:MAG TPA: aldehyde ferredoxin oxidoreductase N-terminal domain-containing protein, partial [Chloroflexota bacterium]